MNPPILTNAEEGAGNSTNATCVACEAIVKLVDMEVTIANATIKDIEFLIKVICATFPVSKKTCMMFVNDLDKIVQMIEQGLKPDKICEILHFCPPTAEDLVSLLESLLEAK